MALGFVLIGTGVVGAELLSILHDQIPILLDNNGLQIQMHGIANSRRMFLSREPLSSQTLSNEAQWKESLENGSEMNLDLLTQYIISLDVDHKAIIDCTASDAVTNFYSTWIRNSVHVVTPNKKLGSGPYSRYQELKELQRNNGSHFFYEGTVGAGLPVISTLKTLLATGDRVLRILAICSGTLSYIFNNLDENTKFCDVVKSAKESGFTEPDPRDDLAGTDVSRKICILARECGSKIELEQVQTQNLVPPGLEDSKLSIDGFLDALVEVC
jgi:aspartokinase/homoserine dehydrogenase 1